MKRLIEYWEKFETLGLKNAIKHENREIFLQPQGPSSKEFFQNPKDPAPRCFKGFISMAFCF